MEDAVLELLEQQKQLESRLVDQEGCSRRENVRIYGVKEGGEDSGKSFIDYVEALVREKLQSSTSLHIQIERAHRALTSCRLNGKIHCGENREF